MRIRILPLLVAFSIAFDPLSALAHDPIIVTDDQTTPADGPFLPDGTVSFALYGSVNINETSNYWDQLAPFGGTGQSGVGRELSQWFLETYAVRSLEHCDPNAQQKRISRGTSLATGR